VREFDTLSLGAVNSSPCARNMPRRQCGSYSWSILEGRLLSSAIWGLAQTEEAWAQFLEDDEKRTGGHRCEFIFGYLSIASLLGGLILGALGLVL